MIAISILRHMLYPDRLGPAQPGVVASCTVPTLDSYTRIILLKV